MTTTTKAWIHSLVAAAIGGAFGAVADSIHNGTVMPQTPEQWKQLGWTAFVGAISVVAGLWKSKPTDSTPPAANAVAGPRALGIAVFIALATLGVAGCKTTKVQVPPSALSPTDAYVNDILQAGHHAAVQYEKDVAAGFKPTEEFRAVMKALVEALNIADPLYQHYHALLQTQPTAPVPAELSNALTQVSSALGKVPSVAAAPKAQTMQMIPIPLLVSLITGLATTLMGLLSGQGVVTGKIADLVDQLVALGADLFGVFKSGGSVSKELQATLADLQGALKALAADTSLDPTVLAQVEEADRVISAAIEGVQEGEATTDPSTLTPLPPVE